MTHEQMIAECQEIAADLYNEWECDFLDSIEDQLTDGGPLSGHQLGVLDKLYGRACESAL